jgi:hypothetical protein
MSLPGGKSKSRRTLRVATVFTGVAVAAVGMAQAANAQDGAKPAARQASSHLGRATGQGVRIDGSIKSVVNCANTYTTHGWVDDDPTWLHISTHNSPFGHYISVCFGFAGIMHSPPGSGMWAECGGNNYGYINGMSGGGTIESTTFGPGTTYRKVRMSYYDDVLINGWTGDDKCPGTPYWGD